MRFKDWLQKETMTSTSCIAGFSRPLGSGMSSRSKKRGKKLIDEADFSLLTKDEHKKHKAENEGEKVIDDFVQDWDKWETKYKRIGASDTASREAFWRVVKEKIYGTPYPERKDGIGTKQSI